MHLKIIQYIFTIIVTNEVLETYSFKSPSDCGKSSLIGKSMTQFIVGGTDVKPKEFPFMVSLQLDTGSGYMHFCGGTVLNNRWVLTAAHCMEGVDHSMRLLIGSINNTDNNYNNSYGLEKWIKNGCYSENTFNGDIALLKTSTDIEIDGINVSAICLPPKNKGLISNEVILSGWGVWSETNVFQLEEKPNILQKLYTKIVSEEFCQIYMYFLNAGLRANTLNNRFCVYSDNSTVCRGDSGGPLMQIIDGKVYQFGIASFISISFSHINRCYKSNPGFYWNVSESLDWISNAIEKYGNSSEDITTHCED